MQPVPPADPTQLRGPPRVSARKQTVGRSQPSSAPAAQGRPRARPGRQGGLTWPSPHSPGPGQGSDPAPAKTAPASGPPVPRLRLGGRALLPGRSGSTGAPGSLAPQHLPLAGNGRRCQRHLYRAGSGRLRLWPSPPGRNRSLLLGRRGPTQTPGSRCGARPVAATPAGHLATGGERAPSAPRQKP